VIGAGVFGGHHAHKCSSLAGVELTAVLDPNVERAEALAGPLGAAVFDDLAAFLDQVDLVTVASPASSHARLALQALQRGRHVYVEKPLADEAEASRALVAAAEASGVVLACGHQERAVFRAIGLLDLPERPVRIEAVRRGTFTGRNTDVSCVLDLMIHDIDLALTLAGEAPAQVTAHGRITEGPFADEAVAELTFTGGMSARLEASRIAERRERTMKLEFPSGELEIDFLNRRFVDRTPFGLDSHFAESADGKDPLGASVAAFIAAVRGEAARPLVTGEEAARALDVALEVDRKAVQRRPKLRLVR
jgi:predicted dehydrogenase